jgi:Tfp pilus assembly protein PilF
VWRRADVARGIADLDEAIRLDPDLAAACRARGWAYQAGGDHDRANVDYEEAMRRYVDDCPLSLKALHSS